MRFLITNDDGINAEGIGLLAKFAKTLGEVTVVAPMVEQSGKSQAIDFMNPIEVKKVDFMDGVRAFAVNSTPADCVRFGINGLREKFDIVLSGINKGINLGKDIVYSGTVGAILEASYMNCDAIAFSTDPDTLDSAYNKLLEVYNYVMALPRLREHILYNVNIPKDAKDIRITSQGTCYFSDEFIYLGDDKYIQKGECIDDEDPTNENLDFVAYSHGKVSVTPISFNKTDTEAFNRLCGLNK